MKEIFSGQRHEFEPVASTIGDIIIAKDFHFEKPALVVEFAENDTLHAIGIIDDEQNQYTWPGTIGAQDVIRVVGHKSLSEVVDAYTLALSNIQQPSAENRARLHQRLSQQISDRR